MVHVPRPAAVAAAAPTYVAPTYAAPAAPAPQQQQQLMEVVIPAGLVAGQQFSMVSPSGARQIVTVPQGMCGGHKVRVPVAAAPVAARIIVAAAPASPRIVATPVVAVAAQPHDAKSAAAAGASMFAAASAPVVVPAYGGSASDTYTPYPTATPVSVSPVSAAGSGGGAAAYPTATPVSVYPSAYPAASAPPPPPAY
jgi:hypothetical protein